MRHLDILLVTLVPRAAPLAVRRAPSPRCVFGGNPFEGIKNPFANKEDGATCMRLQLAYRCPDRRPSSLLGRIEALADENADDVVRLAEETAMLLLRTRQQWQACCGSVRHYGDEQSALQQFDREAVVEAAKFERESTRGGSSGGAGTAPVDASTVAVVTALATVMGDREEAIGASGGSLGGDAPAMLEALQEVAAAASSNRLFAFELLWVPALEDDGELEMDEVLLSWPELIMC